MELEVRTKDKEYRVCIERGLLDQLAAFVGNRRSYVISDSGVPAIWQEKVMAQLPQAKLFIFKEGEASKNLQTYEMIMRWLAENKASRHDLIIALGGGVTGDISGFAAATYMRGISYINIPTTLLAQVDSSVGGKTAVDLDGIKNIVGAFWQPDLVLIDPRVLDTLDPRQLHNGLAEAIKMGLIADHELFALFENHEYEKRLEEVICRSIDAKRRIVEADERESGLRKILNFGHTLGHAYETWYHGTCLHGECVAMGMMAIMEDGELKERLRKVLEMCELPCAFTGNKAELADIISNDKKGDHEQIDVVLLKEIERPYIETWSLARILEVNR